MEEHLESIDLANNDKDFPDLSDSEDELEGADDALPECSDAEDLGDVVNALRTVDGLAPIGTDMGENPLSKPRERVIHAQSTSSSPSSSPPSQQGGWWKRRKALSQMNLATGEITKRVPEKNFNDFTVGELKDIVEQNYIQKPDPFKFSAEVDRHLDGDDVVAPPGLSGLRDARVEDLCIFEQEEDKQQAPSEILTLSWRSEPEDFANKKWVRIKSVVDSGASAPVAPPQMMPSIKIEPSEGSRRGQRYSSASKHKLRNLGQQHIKAMTENGEPTEVLFQIADVSKPLVSVSAICEKGNRVIFGRAGGVVQNVKTGHIIPFQRENGIYVLSLWLEEGDQNDTNSSSFHRP